MHIPNLVIEVTRRCQLECEHCLRGDTQSIDIDRLSIARLLRDTNITSIGSLTFTGGEPFLNNEGIDYTIRLIKTMKISVGNFYIATNGLIFENNNAQSRRCMETILDLWLLCDDKDEEGLCRIDISVDEFHDTEITDNNLLKAFSFTGERGKSLKREYLIPEGRGAYETQARDPRFQDNEFPDEYPEDLTVYLTAKGGIVWNCDLSYDHQDEESIPIYQAMGKVHRLMEEECQLSC